MFLRSFSETVFSKFLLHAQIVIVLKHECHDDIKSKVRMNEGKECFDQNRI